MGKTFLWPLERWLIRRLIRSPRVGFILVKQYGSAQVWAIKDTSDPVQAVFSGSIDFEDDDEDTGVPDVVSTLDRMYLGPDAER